MSTVFTFLTSFFCCPSLVCDLPLVWSVSYSIACVCIRSMFHIWENTCLSLSFDKLMVSKSGMIDSNEQSWNLICVLFDLEAPTPTWQLQLQVVACDSPPPFLSSVLIHSLFFLYPICVILLYSFSKLAFLFQLTFSVYYYPVFSENVLRMFSPGLYGKTKYFSKALPDWDLSITLKALRVGPIS
jgi:hypothetical protein